MFERFTDRSRRVLVLAQEEARLLNHRFIGSEHILLGLIAENDGVAAQALRSLGISLEGVRRKVAESIGMAGDTPSGSPPFTPRAKKVLEMSLRESMQLGHPFIGTEHLLLGLAREGHGVAAQILVSLGIDMDHVRQRVIEILSDRPGEDASGADPASSGVSSSSILPPVPLSRAHAARFGNPPEVLTCSFCGRDLWEVQRYVSARGHTTICEDCLTIASDALQTSELAVRGEVQFPPRLFGDAPDGNSVGQVVEAYRFAFGPHPGGRATALEDAEELEPHFAEAGRHHPGEPSPVRVHRLRFLDHDTAELEFEVGLIGGPARSYLGGALRLGDRWLVSRATAVRLLRGAGVNVPPRDDETG